MLVGLQLDGKVSLPSSEFDCEETRYNHRFAPFGVLITPPPVHYSQFKEMTDLPNYSEQPTSADLFDSSCNCFQQARIMLENVIQTEEVGCTVTLTPHL